VTSWAGRGGCGFGRCGGMTRRRGLLVFLAAVAGVAGLLAVPGAWAAQAGAVRPALVWGKAIGVPGLGALNRGGDAEVASVSCTSGANCAAGGYYRDGQRHYQGFVAAERRGRWGQATMVPGLGALNKGGNASVVSVSCTSAGNCTAAGDYRAAGHLQGFVVSEKNGRWGRAAGIPGLEALNLGGSAEVIQLSCASVGNCAVAGNYTDGDAHRQGFVASEKNGAWAPAIEVPGLGPLNLGGNAGAWSVSCGTAGNCAVAGDYTDGGGNRQGFVATEVNSTWGQATEVPGLGALNQGGVARAATVSCASAGNCTAGGYYTDSSFAGQGFVAVETNGTWGQATDIPGLDALNNGTDAPAAFVSSVSCAAPGDCLAGGAYGGPYSWAFTASEKNGVWGKATIVPGLNSIVTGRWAEVGPVSCAAPGNCVIAGDYENVIPGDLVPHGFVTSQRNGQWDNATDMPAPKVLARASYTDILSVSCGSPGHGTVGGFYEDSHGHVQGFVTQNSTT
jgi:hypothetical protein